MGPQGVGLQAGTPDTGSGWFWGFFALFFGFFRKTQEKLRKKISLCPPKGVKTLIRCSLLGTPKRGNSDTATPYCISLCNRRLTCNKKYRAPTFNQTGVDKVFMPQRRAPQTQMRRIGSGGLYGVGEAWPRPPSLWLLPFGARCSAQVLLLLILLLHVGQQPHMALVHSVGNPAGARGSWFGLGEPWLRLVTGE